MVQDVVASRLRLATKLSLKSPMPRIVSRVGCVLFDLDSECTPESSLTPIATGYNYNDSTNRGIHAEVACLVQLLKQTRVTSYQRGGSIRLGLYITHSPCVFCWEVIRMFNICEVHYYNRMFDNLRKYFPQDFDGENSICSLHVHDIPIQTETYTTSQTNKELCSEKKVTRKKNQKKRERRNNMNVNAPKKLRRCQKGVPERYIPDCALNPVRKSQSGGNISSLFLITTSLVSSKGRPICGKQDNSVPLHQTRREVKNKSRVCDGFCRKKEATIGYTKLLYKVVSNNNRNNSDGGSNNDDSNSYDIVNILSCKCNDKIDISKNHSCATAVDGNIQDVRVPIVQTCGQHGVLLNNVCVDGNLNHKELSFLRACVKDSITQQCKCCS